MRMTALILDGISIPREQAKPARPAPLAKPAGSPATAAARQPDYDWYRAEARRLRNEAIRETVLFAVGWLRRLPPR